MPTDKRGFEISYSDFWRLYLDAHRRPATRGVHYAATLVGAASTLAAAVLGDILLAPLGIMIAVCMAVGSHRFIEHNRPLIRINPFYGAVSDLRMMWLAITGGLPAEYARLGLGAAAQPEATAPFKI
ncbi:Mpo1-like protein [Dongia sp.]|uniref:Mpo1-like protein n=1 Tax=Dongia sp. TaxID=1977262 RepID=UPI0037508F4D